MASDPTPEMRKHHNTQSNASTFLAGRLAKAKAKDKLLAVLVNSVLLQTCLTQGLGFSMATSSMDGAWLIWCLDFGAGAKTSAGLRERSVPAEDLPSS